MQKYLATPNRAKIQLSPKSGFSPPKSTFTARSSHFQGRIGNPVTIFKILWPQSLAQSAVKVEKSWNLKKSWHKLFLIMRVRVIRQIFQLQFMIEKPRPDLLTLSKTLYDLSVSRNLFSKAEMRQFGASGSDGFIPAVGSWPSAATHYEKIDTTNRRRSIRRRRMFVVNNRVQLEESSLNSSVSGISQPTRPDSILGRAVRIMKCSKGTVSVTPTIMIRFFHGLIIWTLLRIIYRTIFYEKKW